MTMGQAVAGLITHELAAIVDQAIEDPTFDLESACKEREERLDAQARDLEEELVREREARLRR
jgi:hypothetical protein